MGLPDSSYLSPSSDDLIETSPRDDQVQYGDESEPNEAEVDDDDDDDDGGGDGDELVRYSEPSGYSSRFTSHWSQPWSRDSDAGFTSHWAAQPWSKDADVCTSPAKPSQLLLTFDDSPAQESAGVVDSTSSFPLSENNKPVVKGAGLANLGNTCFLNSVLQCFMHTVPLLRGVILDMQSSCNKEGFCVLCDLRELVELSLTSTDTVVSPWKLANNLSSISSSFQRYQQEDAHEFLQCFLDRLESCHDSDHKDHTSPKSDNLVKQVFGGRLVSKLKCCNCGHCSDTYEPSVDLSLEIEDADHLLTALQSFTKVEKIEDPEMKFTCDKCKEQVSVEKQLSFDQAPSVAAFHLKRFKNDGYLVQKIDKHVAFPLELDLLPFTGSGKNNDMELKYVLYGIVVHTGLTSTSGHYYCFVRLSPNMWCKFDDSKVFLVHEAYVLSQEAYILFYAKEGTSWFSSFIESLKSCGHSSIWNNTSPKSVLYNASASSVSCSSEDKFNCDPKEAGHDIRSEHMIVCNDKIENSEPVKSNIESNGNKHEIENSELVKSNIESNGNRHDIENSEPVKSNIESNGGTDGGMSASAAPISCDSSAASLPKAQKVISPTLLKRFDWSPDIPVVSNSQNDTIRTPLRSPSPEIYREDQFSFSIPRDHLRLANNMSCKRRLDKDMDDLEKKQACSFIKKTMPRTRAQQLLAAVRGSKSEGPVRKKKSRISGLSSSKDDTHQDSSIRPVLRPLVAGNYR